MNSEGCLTNALTILLADKDAGDLRLIEEQVLSINPSVKIHSFTDGKEALRFVKKEGAYQDACRPHFIASSLHMPNEQGFSLLKEVKRNPSLSSIPFVVFSHSQNLQEIQWCYHLQANCYFHKPLELDQFLSKTRWIFEFWMRHVVLPSEPSNPP